MPIISHVNDMVSSQQGQHMLVVECVMGPQLVPPKMFNALVMHGTTTKKWFKHLRYGMFHVF